VTRKGWTPAMSDRAKIGVGLVVFVALVTFPVWRVLGAGEAAAPPELELPADAAECVEDTPYMQSLHMDLLNRWRDAVVRQGEREYTSASTGRTYLMSLTGTCLDCHSDRDTFCNRCHEYADVAPTCWDCHVDPGGN